MAVPEDVGCKNESCLKYRECNRAKIAREGKAREVKSFGGTPEKGCGKFIPLKRDWDGGRICDTPVSGENDLWKKSATDTAPPPGG